MSINVTVVGSTGVTTSIASSDQIVVAVGGTLANTPLTALQVTAGANITITTTSGVYTFVGPNVPVQSVNGQTGTVVLNLANLTAAAASHTHVMANITDLAFPVNTVNGQAGTVLLTSTDVSAASAVHAHVASDITNLTSVANVVSVNGQTGVAVLNSTNVSAASAVHTHVMANITDLAFPVSSVNGKTGTVSLTITDLTAAAVSHTHVASDITNLTSVANVVSVNGYTGVVALTTADITAAAATHTHSMAEVADITFPVNSVNGKTGTVVLTNVDVSAAATSHTHVASDITNLTSVANVVSVNGITGTPAIVGGVGVTVSTSGSSITIEAAAGGTASGASLSDALPQALGSPTAGISGLASRSDHAHAMPSAADVGAAAIGHTHSIADVTGLAYPVNSVNGRTGTVTLTITDLTAAAASHTHVASDITNLTSVANVVSVNGQTGVAVLSSTNVSAASAVHTHVMADVTDLSYPVNSVNGRTGTVTLTITDLTAAAASHTHAASEVTDLTSVANVVSVNGQTGVVTITLGDALPSQGGNANRILATDGTAASWATRYSVVDPVLVAGTGLSFSRDTSAGSITIEANGGIVGSTAASVSTKALSADQNDYDAGVADIVRLTPSANVTLTGLAGGSDGVVRVLYNVGTHVVTLTSQSTASQATNRFVIVSGNVTLDEGDSSSVWYDGTSQRWRVLEDQVTGGGGSGGGIAMSYLFG